jgi:hypothetical protein
MSTKITPDVPFNQQSTHRFSRGADIMKTFVANEKSFLINGREVVTDFRIRKAFCLKDKIIVMLDPNDYLNDTVHGKEYRRGLLTVQNLLAFDCAGRLIWKAEYPEQNDHYFEFYSIEPLCVDSFSGYRCWINTVTGKIEKRIFHK